MTCLKTTSWIWGAKSSARSWPTMLAARSASFSSDDVEPSPPFSWGLSSGSAKRAAFLFQPKGASGFMWYFHIWHAIWHAVQSSNSCDTYSDIWQNYGIYIVTFYLAHIHIYTVYNYMHICIYSNNSSDILSDIHSDVLSDMLSDRSCDIIGIYSDTVICHSIWHEYILTLYLPPTVTFHLAFCLGRCRSCSMGVPCLIRIDPHLKEEESTRKPIAKHHPLGQMDNSK